MATQGQGVMDPAILDDIIRRLTEVRSARPGKQVQLSEGEIKQLCVASREIFIQQPNLLELAAPIKICGAHYLSLLLLLLFFFSLFFFRLVKFSRGSFKIGWFLCDYYFSDVFYFFMWLVDGYTMFSFRLVVEFQEEIKLSGRVVV
jgi:hypothetical protein